MAMDEEQEFPLSSSRKRVVWDEANLAENEKIQQEFAGVTVPEPKTPYHRHSSPGFELDDSSNLGEGHPAAPASSAFDYVMNHGGADFHPDAEAVPDSDGANILADAAGMLANGSSPDRRWTTDSCGGMSSGKRSERSLSEARSLTSSEGSGERSAGKRQRFEAVRRAHYNMREALRLGRRLTSESEDDTRDDEGAAGEGEGEEEGEEVEEQMQDCGSSRLVETLATAGPHPSELFQAASGPAAAADAAANGAPMSMNGAQHVA